MSDIIKEAIEYLGERGKLLGVDFVEDEAVATADQIAFDEECARQRKEDEFIGFDGQNCDDPCEGWDMESRRCECGNRRVSWSEGMGHSFKKPHVYAEAY